MKEEYEPMPDGLVKMILKTAGFNSPEEVKSAVKEVLIIPRILNETERKLERTRKASRDCKRRQREREREELRQKELVNENNTIDT